MHREVNVTDSDFNPVRKSRISVLPNRIVSDARDDHDQLTKLRQMSLLPYSHRGRRPVKLKHDHSILSKSPQLCLDFDGFKKYVIANTGLNNTGQFEDILKLSAFGDTQMYLRAALHSLFIEKRSSTPMFLVSNSSQLPRTILSGLLAKKAAEHGKQLITIAAPLSGNNNDNRSLELLIQDQLVDCISRIKAVYGLKRTVTFQLREGEPEIGPCELLDELYKVLNFVSYLTRFDRDVPHREFMLGIFIDNICSLRDPVRQKLLDTVDVAPIPTFFCSIARTDTTAMRLPVVIQDFNSFDFETYLAMVRLLLTIPPNNENGCMSVPTGPESLVYGELWNERILTLLDVTDSKLWEIVHSSFTSSISVVECIEKIHSILRKSEVYQSFTLQLS